jgi:prolipoprotein diacylglyceryltransferase
MSLHPVDLVVCLFGLIAIFGTVFWIWMIIDCAKNEPENTNNKIVWILIVVLLGFLGALIYFFARRPTRQKTLGR